MSWSVCLSICLSDLGSIPFIRKKLKLREWKAGQNRSKKKSEKKIIKKTKEPKFKTEDASLASWPCCRKSGFLSQTSLEGAFNWSCKVGILSCLLLLGDQNFVHAVVSQQSVRMFNLSIILI